MKQVVQGNAPEQPLATLRLRFDPVIDHQLQRA